MVREVFAAVRANYGADIWIEGTPKTWEPREHAYGVEVFAESIRGARVTGHVSARMSGPRDELPRAASWDDWGYVIAALFNLDPDARIGFYKSEAEFVEKVRKSPRKGSSLPFLDILVNIGKYQEEI
jgi:hypothetical protein